MVGTGLCSRKPIHSQPFPHHRRYWSTTDKTHSSGPLFPAPLSALTSTSITFLTERRLPERDSIVPEVSPFDFNTPLEGEAGRRVEHIEQDGEGEGGNATHVRYNPFNSPSSPLPLSLSPSPLPLPPLPPTCCADLSLMHQRPAQLPGGPGLTGSRLQWWDST